MQSWSEKHTTRCAHDLVQLGVRQAASFAIVLTCAMAAVRSFAVCSSQENDIISKLLQRIADNRLALTNYYGSVCTTTSAGIRTVSRSVWSDGLKFVLHLSIPFLEFQDYLGLPKLGVDGKRKGEIDYQAFLLRFRPSNGMIHSNTLNDTPTSPTSPSGTGRSLSRSVNQTVEAILEMLAKHKYELESLFRHFGQ